MDRRGFFQALGGAAFAACAGAPLIKGDFQRARQRWVKASEGFTEYCSADPVMVYPNWNDFLQRRGGIPLSSWLEMRGRA